MGLKHYKTINELLQKHYNLCYNSIWNYETRESRDKDAV